VTEDATLIMNGNLHDLKDPIILLYAIISAEIATTNRGRQAESTR